MFTRSDGIWTQQGSKLVGTGANQGEQGYSVSISSDGNTAIVGGVGVWIWTYSGGVWTQQGSKMYGTTGYSSGTEKSPVSLSSDGYTVLVGEVLDNSGSFSTWVFTRNSVPSLP